MPRACSVCTHRHREAIDRGLASGSSNLSLSSKFDVSEAAIRRHAANHLPATVAKAAEAEEVARSSNLLADIHSLQNRTLAILEAAEAGGQHRTALSAIREARSNLELAGKLAGSLDESPTVNITLQAQWITIRTAMMEALSPYPQAAEAVAYALTSLEGATDGRN